jgi:mono/diheme cytochrome c family protein
VQLTKTGEVADLCRDVSESEMPEFGQALSDREIVDVLSYIKSTWSENIRVRHDEINLLYEGQNTAVRELLDLSDS